MSDELEDKKTQEDNDDEETEDQTPHQPAATMTVDAQVQVIKDIVKESGVPENNVTIASVGAPTLAAAAVPAAATQTPAAQAAEAPTPAPAAETKKKDAGDLKIVILLKEDRALIGVQAPDCDPIYETVLGTELDEVLASVPNLLKIAKDRWATNPRNPKAEIPPPPPRATPAASTTSSKKATATAPAAPLQRNFF